MTQEDQTLIAWFADRDLPTGRVKFTTYETTDDLAHPVALAIERIENGWLGADTARATLHKVRAYVEGLAG